MKLSRKAWNNVIIFSVASMILTFKFIERQEQSVEPIAAAQQTLLPAGSTILKLQLPGRTLERRGTDWHSEPPLAHPVAVIDAWLHIDLDPWEGAIGGAASSQTVNVYLAKLNQPIELTLFELGQQRFITNWQGQLFSLGPDAYQSLFPARQP